MGLQINQPLFLLLIIPIVALLGLYWKKNHLTPSIEKYSILSLRALIFLLLVFALAQPYIQYPVKGMTTVFVVDHSESVRNQENAMYSKIEQAISAMDVDDQYAVIHVAEDAQVAQSLSSRDRGVISTSITEQTAFTNLEEGVQLAASLLPTNSKGRIVLLTDGNENIGDVKHQIQLLNDQNVPVDIIPFTTVLENDVALESVDLPSNLYLGEQATIAVTLESTINTNSRILISNNNETIIDEEIQLKEGRNQYSFNYTIPSTGNHRLQVEVFTENDQRPQNNVGYALTNVQGPPTILLVEEVEGDGENIKAALEAAELPVTTIHPQQLPTTMEGILNYNSIVFANVSATEITEEQMEIIESAVQDFGVGFVMTGGNRSYGLGGYFKTPIERVLPVEMDLKGKKELPSLGMMFVIDRSGSMSGYKMDLAKEAAARSVELLRDKDTLGLIAFDDRPWQIIETGPLNDKEEAIEQIRSITEGGGTEIYTSLQQAYSQLEPLELQRKHIILLTDGQSATSGDYYDLINNGLENNVTLSTVAIGNDADRVLLEELATEGTGRFYDVQDASQIPSVLSRETILTTRTYIEDHPFFPIYREGTNWSTNFSEGVPQMNAYVATDPKARAEQVLISEKEDPVLIRWQYGLGNTVAWTSDVSGEWSGDWPLWENWSKLWNDIISWSLPSYQNDEYHIQQTMNGREVVLQVTSENPNLLPMEARVVDENGQEIESEIRLTAPGEHEVIFQADTGIYFLQLNQMEEENVISSFQTGVVVPYSKEFAITEQNQPLIEEISQIGDGKRIESPEEAFRPIEGEFYDRQSIYIPLILLAFMLFFIEIAVRRFGLVSILDKIKDSFNNKTEDKNERKKNIDETYSQLKKATSKTVKNNKVQQKTIQSYPNPNANRRSIRNKKELQRKVETEKPIKNNDTSVESSNDRMKRLLDAKNRKK